MMIEPSIMAAVHLHHTYISTVQRAAADRTYELIGDTEAEAAMDAAGVAVEESSWLVWDD